MTSISWSILCDFDGTIAIEDVIDSLLDRFGRPGWQQLERDWRAGRIGSATCMTGQVALLDMSEADLSCHLGGLRIDQGFASFVSAAAALDIPIEIVSDGLDRAIAAILDHHGITGLPTVANHLQISGHRQWRLTSPFRTMGCRAGTCKCARVDLARARRRRTLLIGDGGSDFCAADRVDFVFAKNRLIEHCRAAGIPYVPITGFDEARHLLPDLLAGRLPVNTPPSHRHSAQELPA